MHKSLQSITNQNQTASNRFDNRLALVCYRFGTYGFHNLLSGYMDNSYIFTIEPNLKHTLKQFNNALNADRKDFESYKEGIYKKTKTVERWENKLTAYMDSYNDLEFLLNRAIMVDHERSTYLQTINKLKNDVKRLDKYLNMLSVTKKIEIEAQVQFKTEQRVNQLCKQAEQEFEKELELIKESNFLNEIALNRRVAL